MVLGVIAASWLEKSWLLLNLWLEWLRLQFQRLVASIELIWLSKGIVLRSLILLILLALVREVLLEWLALITECALAIVVWLEAIMLSKI